MTEKIQRTKSFFSQNFLEILIVCLLVWILGQNITFQNKMDAITGDYNDRFITLEWALLIDPDAPQWIKDQILSRSGNTAKYNKMIK